MGVREHLGLYSRLPFRSRLSYLFCEMGILILLTFQIARSSPHIPCYLCWEGSWCLAEAPMAATLPHTQRGGMPLCILGSLVSWENWGLWLPGDLSSNPSPFTAVGCWASSPGSLSSLWFVHCKAA